MKTDHSDINRHHSVFYIQKLSQYLSEYTSFSLYMKVAFKLDVIMAVNLSSENFLDSKINMP